VITLENVPDTIQVERVVMLQGSAENIAFLSLNGRQIYTDKKGYFQETLVLENGYTVATVQAQDRYGRSSSYTKEFVYIIPEAK
jgi:hypothetical protein